MRSIRYNLDIVYYGKAKDDAGI